MSFEQPSNSEVSPGQEPPTQEEVPKTKAPESAEPKVEVTKEEALETALRKAEDLIDQYNDLSRIEHSGIKEEELKQEELDFIIQAIKEALRSSETEQEFSDKLDQIAKHFTTWNRFDVYGGVRRDAINAVMRVRSAGWLEFFQPYFELKESQSEH